MILLIDNYDSFSFNLFQLIGSIDPDIRVIRNDELTVDEILGLNPERIILSPGPGRPENAGCIPELIKRVTDIPLLGVCLGHQAICQAFGGTVTYAKTLMHGKQSIAKLDIFSPIFADCPKKTPVARYHSLAADPDSLPAELRVIAQTEDGEVMAVQHERLPIFGLQFHPESILTPEGRHMLSNFMKYRFYRNEHKQ